MSEFDQCPIFDERDRAILAIKESRSRADQMRELIVPKLQEITRVALARIEAVYGIDPYSNSNESLSPSHRPGAAATRAFEEASAGLVMRKYKSNNHYLKFRFSLSEEGLVATIDASRPLESEAFLGLLREHKEHFLDILDDFEINVWCETQRGPDDSNGEVIDSAKVDSSKQWWHSGLVGSVADFPIESEQSIDILIDQFLVMFPFYQAVCERLAGQEDHFGAYLESLRAVLSNEDEADSVDDENERVVDDKEVDRLNVEPSAMEGEIIESVQRRRRREQKLREDKIQEVLSTTCRLSCEVPGCGFDFLEVYGERGRGFAHVHHKKSLGMRSGPSETRLRDLMIVCANCHTMIHRGNELTSLDGLIQRGRGSEKGSD